MTTMYWWRNERESSTFSQCVSVTFLNFYTILSAPVRKGGGFFKETIIMLTEKYTIEKADNGYILREECGVTVHLMDTTLYKELLGGLIETLNTTTNNKVSVTITIE